ncbi:glycosyltransferase family 4 protein [Parapedomonas caeni]
MPRRRWLHVFSTFDVGGPQVRACQLMNIWGDAIEHHVASANAGQYAARALVEPVVPLAIVDDLAPFKGPALPVRLWKIGQALARSDYDLVLTYNWGAIEVALANRLLARVPLVHHEDGFGPDEAAGTLPRRDLIRRLALPGAGAVVACSRRIEQLALTRWGQSTARVHYVPNGVDVLAFDRHPAPDAIPGLTRRPGDLVVGTMAGLRPEKNLRRLVRAFALATRGRGNVRLVIAGKGVEEAGIRAEAQAYGVADQLLLPGYLRDPARYVGLFDVFAISSDTEQFPISLVEAMAARLPAICTDVGDIADIVATENSPYVVPATDEAALARGLERLLADAELRHRIGNANRVRVESQFSQQRMVESYRAIYAEVGGIGW